MIKITFPDGNQKEYEQGIKVIEVAKDISISLAKKVIAGKIDGVLVDGLHEINSDGAIELILENSEEALEILNHSSAHLLAQAIKNLYPEAKFEAGKR